MPTVTARLTDPDYGFTVTDQADQSIHIDIPVDQGGNGKGFRPMQTILASLCGCSGVDIISILKKQRQTLEGLEIIVNGEREKEKEPALWEKIDIQFRLSGKIDPDKAYRAASLSVEKYCSVAETLRRAGASIHFSVFVNGQMYKPS
jgi:putative redox protein